VIVDCEAQPDVKKPVAVVVATEAVTVELEKLPKVCETMFWSSFQFIPPESRPIKPFVYWLEIASVGTNKPFKLSTIVAEVNGSTIHDLRPSRGAPSESRYACADKYVYKPVGGVPAVPTMLAVFKAAVVVPSKSILLAIAATAGFRILSLNISKDNAKSCVVNCVILLPLRCSVVELPLQVALIGFLLSYPNVQTIASLYQGSLT